MSSGGGSSSGASSGSSSGGSSASSKSSAASAGSAPSGLGDLELTPAEHAQFKKIFDHIDKGGDGIIETRELKIAMEDIGASAAAADMQAMIQLADSDVNGTIDFREFCLIMRLSEKFRFLQLRDAFNTFDRDHSGKITPKELEETLELLGMKLTPEQKATMIKKADKDGDGQINVREFASIMGYAGRIYTDEELKDVANLNMGGGGDSERSGDVSQSGEVDLAPPGGVFVINCTHFYTRETVTVKATTNMQIKKFTKLAAKAFGQESKRLRLYYNGVQLKDGKKRLSEYRISALHPVMVVYNTVNGPLATSQIWDHGVIQPERIYDHFLNEGLLSSNDAKRIVRDAAALLDREDTLIEVQEPCVIVGDIHGQFFDMEQILNEGNRDFEKTNWVFLGDYVDRGVFSCEVLLYVLALKLRYPDNVTVLRGNHESQPQNASCGSMMEWALKYDAKFYDEVVAMFYTMPLAAVVHAGGKKFLCSHGGISKEVDDISEYNNIDRKQEVPQAGAQKVILWADPYKDTEGNQDYPTTVDVAALEEDDIDEESDFGNDAFHSSARSKTVQTFGLPAIRHFLKKNHLVCIFRGHEQKQEGYEYTQRGSVYNFPAVVTIFSAPNYTDTSMNRGAVGVFPGGGKFEIRQFRWNVHPQYFPMTVKHGQAHPQAGQKDLATEDFLLYVHALNEAAVMAMPVHKLKAEYAAAFAADRGQASSTASKGLGKQEERIDDPDFWKAVQSNLNGILQTSTDPAVRRKWRKKSQAMVAWYTGFDHFHDAVQEESVYEVDSDQGGTGSNWTSARENMYSFANKSKAKFRKTVSNRPSCFGGSSGKQRQTARKQNRRGDRSQSMSRSGSVSGSASASA